MREAKTAVPSTETGQSRPALKKRRRPLIDRLKAERIQLRLERLPGWELSTQGIRRFRSFPTPRAAAAYAAFAAEMVEAQGLPAAVAFQGSRISLLLRGEAEQEQAEITDAVFDLAEMLG